MTLKLRLWVGLLAVIMLGACNTSGAAGLTPTVEPPTHTPNIALTATFSFYADYAFSRPLVNRLVAARVDVQSVGASTLDALFDVPRLAVSIHTNQGIVEAVYFDNPVEAGVVSIVPFVGSTDGHYLYQVQALPPLLEDERIIDSGYPLYHIIYDDMLLVTASDDLYDILEEVMSDK